MNKIVLGNENTSICLIQAVDEHDASFLTSEYEKITDLSGRKDISKQLAQIRSILTLAEESLSEDELDRSFVDRFIKQILVYPEDHGMRLEIQLNMGEKLSKTLIKPACRTGQASKKMIESYENGLK